MYAIIQSGSKQYRVETGDVIDVELIKDHTSKVEFSNVLLYRDEKNTSIGTPHLPGYKVEGEVLDEVKGDKVVAYHYKRRKSAHRKVGHRQKYLRVKITAITSAQGK